MTMFNTQGVLMDKWFKAPNAIVDDITGDIISPQAAAILNSILRLTSGVRDRKWAAIPHSFFMRKTRAKRRETIGNYINELIDNKLINVNKSNGKVTEYAINWQSNLWYSTPELEQINVSSVPVRLIRTSTLQPYTPVRFIRTGSWQTSTFHPYTYKDILPKDNNKDIQKASDKKTQSEKNSKPPAQKPKTLNIPFDEFWNTYDKKKETGRSEKKWSSLTDNERELIMNHIPAYVQSTPDKKYRKNPMTYLNGKCWLDEIDQPQPNQNQSQSSCQGNTNANNQPVNSQHQQFDTSTTAGYAAKLDADADAYYAEQAAIAQQAAYGSTENAF